MIKEYFTDGLIGLAILLSLLRTDLGGINNIIDYPEVQDVILGQTAAYLPVNFHNYRNSRNVFSHRKHVDFDNEAFTAWYQNVQNLPRYRVRQDNEIEAFLVNAPLPTPIVVTGNHFPTDTEAHSNSNVEGLPEITSPTLPLEGANSFEHQEEVSTVTESEEVSSLLPTSSNETRLESQNAQATTSVDVTFLFTNPFPGCNLTKEDLDLIDVLWRQDVDLGVGKEVYDTNLRLEQEKERELNLLREQEKRRAQELNREKEERQRHEQANRWLKENFRRDGETGEWVRLQNQTRNNATGFNNSPLTALEENNNSEDDFMTLDAALDYIYSVDLGLPEQQTSALPTPNDFTSEFTDVFLDNSTASQEYLGNTQYLTSVAPQVAPQQVAEAPIQQQQQQQQQHGVILDHQDSLEDNWNGLVDYLNMAATSTGSDNAINTTGTAVVGNLETSTLARNNLVASSLMATPEEHLTSAMALTSEMNALTPDLGGQRDFLLQNATMPTPDVNITTDFGALHPIENILNGTGPNNVPEMDDPMDWDFNDLGLFDNLTSGAAALTDLAEAGVVDDLDLEGVGDIFLNLNAEMAAHKESEGRPVEEDLLSESSAVSLAGSTPHQDLGDVFDGLEGAIGGSNHTANGTSAANISNPFSKVSRLSESSNDSGFIYQGGFSSSSSAGSSYAGSPAGSNHGAQNHSTSSNDTEVDPKGSRTVLARGHVAHNHTYNTPPGQTPREVKKYAPKEPSRKGPQSRDERRATELKIPFSLNEIIDSPVDTFNELLTKYKLTEPQLALIRDIRRRGKNKVAAQNCRKRKVGVIVTLSDEMVELQKTRDRLVAEQAEMEREMRHMKDKFGQLYTDIFQSLRDEDGQPYDPSVYSLQQSSDGNVFLVPRNVTASKPAANSSASSSNSSSSSSSSNDSGSKDSGYSRKRKAY